MATARRHFVVLSLALLALFGRAVPAQAQDDGLSTVRLVPAGEMPVHEIKPGKLDVIVEGRGSIEAAQTADLYCPIGGQSSILTLVPEGRVVKKGDLVCELDSSALRDQLRNQEISEQRRRRGVSQRQAVTRGRRYRCFRVCGRDFQTRSVHVEE